MLGLLVTKVFADGTVTPGVGVVTGIIYKINQYIINPFIEILFVIAFLSFLRGIIEFLWGSQDLEKIERGRQHMLYGIIGFFVMVASFAIINMFLQFIGAKTIGN